MQHLDRLINPQSSILAARFDPSFELSLRRDEDPQSLQILEQLFDPHP